MSNSLISVQAIARQTMPRLMENLVFPNLSYWNFDDAFSQRLGDTVQVRKPVALTASEFNAADGASAQSITEATVYVQLNKIATVDVEIEAIEGATSVDSLNRVFVEPAAAALAEKINSDGLSLYKDIAQNVGTAGSPPDTVAKLTDIVKAMNKEKIPFHDRNLVLDPEAEAKLISLGDLFNAEKSGSTEAIREARVGRVLGMDTFMCQGVKAHATGITAATAVKVNTAVSAGATSLNIDGTSLTGKLLKGDLIKIGGRSYTVTEDSASATSNAIAGVKVYPALPSTADNADVTLVGAHTANLAFHPMAFCFATRPLVAPAGVESYVTNYGGLSLRVVRGYNMQYKRETLSMDVLYGYKTLYPELAVRVLG